jgi:hypothetical protein
LSLQDRLGLAKVKYQNGRVKSTDLKNVNRRNGSSSAPNSDRPSDSSSELLYNRYETPLTSSPHRNATFSSELPRSARNKHAATFDKGAMEPMLNASRKRVRSGSFGERAAKMPRLSWKSSHKLPESSPGLVRYNNHASFVLDAATIPEIGDSKFNINSDEDNDPDLPSNNFHNMSSSMISSSPPRTPPLTHARLPKGDKDLENEDGADLLLFLANSPTPARITSRANTREYLPSTPPSKAAALPCLTPTLGGGIFANFGTPGQQFNFADFVNVTPSPAQRPWGARTPGSLAKTPLLKEARKRLNFDNLMPPMLDSPRSRGKEAGLALQLGEELRP